MAEVNWNALYAYPNAGQAFGQAFQQGIQDNRANLARSAMAALAQNPNDSGALAALAKADPGAAMQFKAQQAQTMQAQLARHQDNIIKGAEIIRQFQPKDQQSYSAALAAAQQAGIDISEVPQVYNPEYVSGIVHLADALKPQPQTTEPNIQREVDYYKSIGRPDLAEQILTNHAQGSPIVQQNANGTVTVYPRSLISGQGQPAQSAPVTATDAHGNKVQFNPQSGQWEPVNGGQSGGSSAGGFQ